MLQDVLPLLASPEALAVLFLAISGMSRPRVSGQQVLEVRTRWDTCLVLGSFTAVHLLHVLDNA